MFVRVFVFTCFSSDMYFYMCFDYYHKPPNVVVHTSALFVFMCVCVFVCFHALSIMFCIYIYIYICVFMFLFTFLGSCTFPYAPVHLADKPTAQRNSWLHNANTIKCNKSLDPIETYRMFGGRSTRTSHHV